MLSIERSTIARWLAGTVLAASVFLVGCGGVEDTITDILELPATETETVLEPVVEPVAEPTETVVTPESDETVDDLLPTATLSGRVVDAVTGAPLGGAVVTVAVPGVADPFTANTNSDGVYLLTATPVTATTVSFTLDGYRPEFYSAISLITNNEQNIGTVRLVSEDNSGVGVLTGKISNALDGSGVEGLTLRFREGINVTSGTVVGETTTDINGEYTISNLPYGNLTCEIIGAGFDTSYANVVVLGNITQADQNSAVSPNLSSGEIRVVLTWGATPSDLDSHLTGPQENTDTYFHLYFNDNGSPLVNLDVDDTTSFGPETVTIERQINGVYRYSVFNYSDDDDADLSASGARVQVFDGSGLIRDYVVPDGLGNLWTVFEMEGGNIAPINTITSLASDNDYFASGVVAKMSAVGTLPAYK